MRTTNALDRIKDLVSNAYTERSTDELGLSLTVAANTVYGGQTIACFTFSLVGKPKAVPRQEDYERLQAAVGALGNTFLDRKEAQSYRAFQDVKLGMRRVLIEVVLS
jgi:hypothetical protein